MTDDAIAEHEAWIRERCPNDLGDDVHRWGWWPWNDHGESHNDIMWVHRCRAADGHEWLSPGRIDISTGQKHQLISRDPLHVEASVLCAICGDHGWIRDGRWVAA